MECSVERRSEYAHARGSHGTELARGNQHVIRVAQSATTPVRKDQCTSLRHLGLQFSPQGVLHSLLGLEPNRWVCFSPSLVGIDHPTMAWASDQVPLRPWCNDRPLPCRLPVNIFEMFHYHPTVTSSPTAHRLLCISSRLHTVLAGVATPHC